MELNRDLIVKALECCASNSLEDCDCCPMDEKKKDNCECGRFLAIQALALLRELPEENEEKDETIAGLIGTIKDSYGFAVREMKARLERNLLAVKDHTGKLGLVVLESDIDQIAKEMLEEGT